MTPCGGSSIAASISKRNVIYPIWNIKLADRQETSVRPRVSLALGASISACLLRCPPPGQLGLVVGGVGHFPAR